MTHPLLTGMDELAREGEQAYHASLRALLLELLQDPGLAPVVEHIGLTYQKNLRDAPTPGIAAIRTAISWFLTGVLCARRAARELESAGRETVH